MRVDEGDVSVPVGWKGVPPSGWLPLAEAVALTGVAGSTLRRRVDAWLTGDEKKIANGYAVKGARTWGGRLVGEVDAERVRLQHAVRLGMGVTVRQWEQAVESGVLPDGADVDPGWWAGWRAGVLRRRAEAGEGS